MVVRKTDRSFESLKIFPYVAWAITMLFAFFVYHIALELEAVTRDLQTQTRALEEKVNMPVGDIEDFSL
ncbi:MAG: hypothetical protein AAB388_04805 [Patescibacteria group bacterium]